MTIQKSSRKAIFSRVIAPQLRIFKEEVSFTTPESTIFYMLI